VSEELGILADPSALRALLYCLVEKQGGSVLVVPTAQQMALQDAGDPEVGVLRYELTDEGILLTTGPVA
jgi:hypothetical protein